MQLVDGHQISAPTRYVDPPRAAELFEAVQAWRPFVASRLSGLGNLEIDDVLQDARLSLLPMLNGVRSSSEVSTSAAYAVRVRTLRARAAAIRERDAAAPWVDVSESSTASEYRPSHSQMSDSSGKILSWLPRVLRPPEVQLLEELWRCDGDMDEALRALAWPSRQGQRSRALLAATAETVSNALSVAESRQQLPALRCLPIAGPWRKVVTLVGQPYAHTVLGISTSRWRGLRADAEFLMRTARAVLSAGRIEHAQKPAA